ncbi:hypothetical protein TCSYLVIO_005777 [Trypanosoma cruzi]|nr:hypothetical protein TCSYLVIO_005777 [Trypanosoma cruzi]
MKSVEYKLARLEEQNASLRQKLRHQENEISRLSVRESQLKEARRMPLLQKRLNTALTEREELECQLAETRGREARLSDEVKLLRMFIKISENPEIAETARQYVSHERIQVELKVLGEQLRSIATERDEYKKRVLLSCEEAECYRDKWNASLEEKRKLEEYIKKLVAEQPLVPTVIPSPSCRMVERCASCGADTATRKTNEDFDLDEMQYLRRSLEEEKARSEALQETIDALYEQQRGQRRSCSLERRITSPPASGSEPDIAGKDGTSAGIYTLRQKIDFVESECRLVKNRWHALREQNKILLSRISELELTEAAGRGQIQQLSGECEQLRRELEFVLKARTLIACHHDEPVDNEAPKEKDGLTP